MSGAWAAALAPCKVNLRLEVLGRRPDGYCEIETLMMALDLCDRVRARASAAPGVRLRVSGPQCGPEVPGDERNLAHRAAAAVLERAGRGAGRAGLELELEKRIPSAAGLGGASSDAAAALLAAEAALGVRLPARERQELLAGLGSDCPFFLAAAASGLARCRGRGEQVEPIERPPPDWWVLLVTPSVAAPTGSVYRALAHPLCPAPRASSLPESTLSRPAAAARGDLFNHLEDAALRAVPGLSAWKDALTRRGARHLRLAGSGSTFFGLYDRREEAEADLADELTSLRSKGFEPRFCALVRPAGRGAVLGTSC